MSRKRLLLHLAIWVIWTGPFIAYAGGQGHSGDESLLEGLRLRSIGPAVMGGRIDDVAVVEERPWILYVGAASGGLWKTTNNGTTWQPVFDDQGTSSIGDVTIAPSDPEIVWVGTGEPNNRQSSSFGDGVYKSMDGGATWRNVGLRDTHHIGRIAIHPRDPDTVYVAALGHLWGPNEERGVFRTADGGKKWEKILYIDADTGVVDLAMDLLNPHILYAAAYQRRRTPWGFDGGGPGSGLYKSVDGGATWKRLTHGLPEGPMGRIGIDIYRADPRILLAVVESRQGGVFRSEDRGETWQRVNELNPRPIYYSQIRVDPSDDRRVYVLGASFYVSSDGGKTFGENTDMSPTYDVGVHGDHHALWIDPANGEHLILGGDGGLYFSWDRSRTWDKVNNIPLAQFYSIAVDMQQPYFIYGGAQDTHSWGGPSATRNHSGILNQDWFQIHFGDGMYQQVDPNDPNVIYTESQGGNIVRFDRRTGDRKVIQPSAAQGEPEYRFHWTAPIRISPHDSKTIYLGGNRLFVSKDRGETWSSTADLTRAEDRERLPIMGVVPDETTLSRHDGVASWGTITTIAESPVSPGLLWVGTDDGLVQVSRDGGGTWKSLAGKFPDVDDQRATVSRVAASHAAPGRAYVSFDRHQLDDFAPYLFTTDDFGQSWQPIHRGLPPVGWINVVAEHPGNTEVLFVGTEVGLFVSLDRGRTWVRLGGGLPTVPVDDLVIHPRDNDLVVATHGRSIYILDDLKPIEQLTADVRASAVQLFDVRAAYEFLPWKHESYSAQRWFVGENPPYGVIVSYYIGSDTVEAPAISILDETGNPVRRLRGTGKRGLRREVWDMRAEPPQGVQRSRGPLVPPGTYRVRLDLGETRLERSVEVKLDPRADVTMSEIQARYQFLLATNRLRATIQEALHRTSQIQTQIDSLLKERADQLPDGLETEAGRIRAEAGRIEKQLAGGGGEAEYSSPGFRTRAGQLFMEPDGDAVRQGTLEGPTAVQRERLSGLESGVDRELDRLNELIERSIPELNRLAADARLPWVLPGEPVRRQPRP